MIVINCDVLEKNLDILVLYILFIEHYIFIQSSSSQGDQYGLKIVRTIWSS